MDIQLIKQLRERTNAGFSDCKKALEEAQGNLEEAINVLRKKGTIKAAKNQKNVAAEGIMSLAISEDKTFGILLEVNCQTDFVAKSDQFIEFVDALSAHVIEEQILRLGNLMKSQMNGKTVEELQNSLGLSVGEKVRIRRFAAFEAQEGQVAGYCHNSKMAALVNISNQNESVGGNIAMHIVASKPLYLDSDDVPDDLIRKERHIIEEQMKGEKKPDHVVQQIIDGRLQKFIGDITLCNQVFVKDSKMKVAEYLEKNNTEALGFILMNLGDGIEVKQVDFAAEVAAQLK